MITCSSCGENRTTAAGAKRLPRGWKRRASPAGEVVCDDCWSRQFVLRSATVPISAPVGRDWSELRAALDLCWSASTGLANWAIMELAKADVVRVPEMGDRMPAMPRVYLYPEARRRFPTLDSKSLSAILNDAQSRYRKSRLASVWLNRERLPCYQYPVPYPVKSEAWSVERGAGGEWLLRLRLAGQPWLLKLRGGHQFRRQLAALTQLSAGTARACAASLYRVRADGSHHAAFRDRQAGGGRKTPSNVMVRFALWLPRSPSTDTRSGMFIIRTSSDALLSAFDSDGKRVASFFADHVPRQVAEHRRALQRLKADLAVARASSPGRMRQLEEFRERICGRQHNRMHSVCHQAAAFVANLAQRKGVAQVQYDDRDRGYAETFPWLELQRLIGEKLDAMGVAFAALAGGAGAQTGQCLPLRGSAAPECPAAHEDSEADRRNAG